MPIRSFAFFAVVAAIVPAHPTFAAEDTAALIQRQSQAFSDASADGDGKKLERYLDDRVTFIDESGTLSTKHDIVASAGPLPSGVKNTLVQSDFHVRIHGNVAVTDFIDNATVQFHGQVIEPKFRSTEVWLREGREWRMISSQTIALPKDPASVTLPAQTLDEYVGTYLGGPGYAFRIARSGDELTGSINGGRPFPLKAEIRDVLFVPGQPRLRRLMTRGADGAVNGIVSRREGYDLRLTRSP